MLKKCAWLRWCGKVNFWFEKSIFSVENSNSRWSMNCSQQWRFSSCLKLVKKFVRFLGFLRYLQGCIVSMLSWNVRELELDSTRKSFKFSLDWSTKTTRPNYKILSKISWNSHIEVIEFRSRRESSSSLTFMVGIANYFACIAETFLKCEVDLTVDERKSQCRYTIAAVEDEQSQSATAKRSSNLWYFANMVTREMKC